MQPSVQTHAEAARASAAIAHAAPAGHAHWETSPWPLVVGVGVLLLLPVSFICYFAYHKPLLAVLSLGVGVPLTVAGVVGWVREGLGHRGEGLSPSAMPWFILAEALIFLSFFAAYWTTRLKALAWPPAGTVELPVVIPLIMTALLVSSSFTIHVAELRLLAGDSRRFIAWLLFTMGLGTGFLGFSMYEWSELFHEGFNFGTNIFSTAFFSITGFHAAHVLVGVGIFLAILLPALGGRTNQAFVKAGSLYWHFVDIVWLFVVTQVYFW